MSASPAFPYESLPRDVDIRLVAIDMDGTLLHDDKSMPEQMWSFLRELSERNVIFTPSSGRQCWTLLDMFERVREPMTVIAENGAIVLRDGAEVSSAAMDHATVREVIRRVRECVATGVNAGLMMCGKVSGYVERGDDEFIRSCIPYYHRTRIVTDQCEILDRMESGDLDDDVIKLAVFCFDAVIPIAQIALQPFADTHQYAISGHNWADLQMKGVDKGSAVRALQQHLGIGPEHTLVFGDFHNDISMLQAAHWSFAMANAHPDVIDAARFIAPSNNEDGVLRVTRHLLGID
ncbi:Cof-type HAD-IIB family hydrolase [Schaalia sp. lx-260]|uniref:Cof-type HAD-IIB family hydrolase n=1 Tax=Schaalia sp. lx-260 TaxID=2899082 RepID=UPI001E3E1707|nr:Cof-type HAD-IIB family hydrolase [Schaalia sp. lx-260]MCD4550034.1 Cof-type HAD-IIB family hydrolase [Schaalia sp. lx-260]